MKTFKKTAIYLLQVSLWPGLLLLGVGGTFLLTQRGYEPVQSYLTLYLAGVVLVFLLERIMPYSLKWRAFDNQVGNDLVHAALSQWCGKTVFNVAGIVLTLYWYGKVVSVASWFHPLPWFVQLLLAMMVCDLGRYIYHRLSHERWGGWAFHSLHHSARRLWVGNTTRSHFIDSTAFTISGFVPLMLLQFPPYIIFWVAVVNSFVGALSHCNIKMRLGVLNYIFNTPILHRWHHSKVIAEGNRNYGQLFTLWDHVFGTYHNPNRPSPEDIGTRHMTVPDNLFAQFVWPVHRLREKDKNFWQYIGEEKKIRHKKTPKKKPL